MDGHEPAQLYLSTANASVPLPIKTLINFQKVFVPHGLAVPLTLTIAPADLAVMRDGDFLQVRANATAPCVNCYRAAVHHEHLRVYWHASSTSHPAVTVYVYGHVKCRS